MIFLVFSFNRGRFLKNCIDSIEHCSPESEIIIYDDQSDDPETKEILQTLATSYSVISGEHDVACQHGGLYTNMQMAFDSLAGDHAICFMQDDTQLVRRVTEEDKAFIDRYFKDHPECGFLAPVFLRRITKAKTLSEFEYVPEYQVYFCRHRNDKCAGVYYSDVVVSTTERMRNAGWRFLQGELENELQAKASFIQMGYMYAPFLMWLPNGPAYRNKKKPLTFRIAEKRNKAGLYPYRYMTAHDVDRLNRRPPAERPIAEDFLNTVDAELRKPWIYHPLKRSRVLRRLYRIESFIKSFFY